ncbi:hypothetical protein CONLIGDRAFT_635712 [Coniochaeta ligniaria NRRL 30616]|uniref:Uncharacterized protein n=1 Tax=Coniochaeta ligniaria NRRL 30616 TaxID=1408157 RepID=A0A1J7J9S4_9PEZI|nr:hypothetical protein CONLIGDRAFT_635712 [Coniochaeta ligniaria NRRL 30616]
MPRRGPSRSASSWLHGLYAPEHDPGNDLRLPYANKIPLLAPPADELSVLMPSLWISQHF